jgi:hypothetical protein
MRYQLPPLGKNPEPIARPEEVPVSVSVGAASKIGVGRQIGTW